MGRPADRFVSAWVGKHISATLNDGYGYPWLDDARFSMALGYGGQFICISPEAELIVVFTRELPEHDLHFPQRLLEGNILPAVLSPELLPIGTDAEALLQQQIESISNP